MMERYQVSDDEQTRDTQRPRNRGDAAWCASVLVMVSACASGGASGTKLKASEARDQRVAHQMEVFDDLDFNVYSNQKWDELKKSHANDIVVHWPDGRTTKGIEPHIEDLKQQFVFAPDTKIKEHPIKVGNGEWTSVVGIMEGTFSRPMPLPDGKSIPPTNKPFKLTMVTVGHWTSAGVMDEEYLFWDNQAFMKQIGLAQ